MAKIIRDGNRIIVDLDEDEKAVLADEQSAAATKIEFRSLPQWATWTPGEAEDFVQSNILSGMTQAQIESWIDTNVTSLATARTALKLLAGNMITIRNILKVIARAIIYFRIIVVRRV